jgi:hypothetical protein
VVGVAYLARLRHFLNEIHLIEGASMDTTLCPECGTLAEVLWRDVVDSTEGPVELAKIGCVSRHWFLLPLEKLERPTPPEPRRHDEPAVLRDSRHAG